MENLLKWNYLRRFCGSLLVPRAFIPANGQKDQGENFHNGCKRSRPDANAGKKKSASSVKAGAEKILFALTAESKKQYLPLFSSIGFKALDYDWIDISSIDAPAWEKALFQIKPTVLVTCWGTPAIPESFARSPDLSLRYICHLAGGVKPMIPRHLIERGVLVSNWGTSISYAVAEHAILLVLAALRNLPTWNSFLDQWPDKITPFACSVLHTRSLRGRRVGLHGFGAIARELVAMLKPFQVELASYSSGVPRSLFEQHGVRCCDSLEELFSGSEVLIECEALTSRSRGSVTEKILRLLPEDAVFVNVGRGRVVDEGALARLASEGRLNVGLDVYDQEPLSLDSPLRQTPHTLLSPHIAGPTLDGFPILSRFAVENIRRYLDGGKIQGLVTLDAYDRST